MYSKPSESWDKPQPCSIGSGRSLNVGADELLGLSRSYVVLKIKILRAFHVSIYV